MDTPASKQPHSANRTRRSGGFYSPRLFCTKGLLEQAKRDRSFWIIEAIARQLGDRPPAYADHRLESFQIWQVTKHEDNSAKLVARADLSSKPHYTMRVPKTDFGLADFRIHARYEAGYWTLCLPWEA